MKTSDFHYELPPGRIAQEPVEPRDAARLYVSEDGVARHRRVRDLADELRPGDLLVVNDTRVRAARLELQRRTGGAVELLLVEEVDDGWRAMVRPAKKLRRGEELAGPGGVRVRALGREGDSAYWTVSIDDPQRPGRPVPEILEAVGRMPLPPYVERARGTDPRDGLDRDRYQTVFARVPGAVAAPTAGLHFTPELFAALDARGVERAALTLHVGPGTFLPVTGADPRRHRMHAERYVLPAETARAIDRCRARGGRVVAVGTTTVRVLEDRAAEDGGVTAGAGETSLFVLPGHRFRVVDALLTNFHLPGSTLLMLVAAFAGRERVLALYADAVERGYRFYSFGDAMLLVP